MIHRIVCFVIIICSTISLAGWSEDIRLTYRGEEYGPQVVARNDTIHVIWRNSPNYVSYIRSTDNGETWNSLINISEEEHIATDQDLSLGENGLLVTWKDRDSGPFRIGYTLSEDGSEWSEPRYLPTDNIGHFDKPASCVWGDLIFISYWSHRADSTGGDPIRFFSSYDYGETWNDEVTMGYGFSTQQDMILTQCGFSLLLLKSGFVDSLHTGYHIVGFHSDNGGQSWSEMIWISPEHEPMAQNPCVACNEETGQFAVGYNDFRYQEYAFHGDIFVSISDDGGLTWPREVQASYDHTAWSPSIGFTGDTLIATWSDRKYNDEGGHEIFYNRSDNIGESWQGEIRLTNAPYNSLDPWISYDQGKIHNVWRDERVYGYNDIYYKRFTPDTTSIDDEEIYLPAKLEITAYPNPFNQSTVITFTLPEASEVHLDIYDILGRRVRSLVNGHRTAGENRVVFDAGELPSGVYFYRLTAGDVSQSRRMVILK